MKKNNRIVFILLVSVLAITYTSSFRMNGESVLFADETGVEIFCKALEVQKNQGAIKSGVISYELKTSFGTKTEQEIQEEIDRRIKENDDLKSNKLLYETIVNGIKKGVRDRYENGVHFVRRTAFDVSDYQNQFYYLEQRPLNGQTSDKRSDYYIERRTYQKNLRHSETVMRHAHTMEVLVMDSGGSYGQLEQFGKIRDLSATLLTASMIQNGTNVTKEILEESLRKLSSSEDVSLLDYVGDTTTDGAKTYIIESKNKNTVFARYHIVPSLGYICPLLQLYDEKTGNLIEEYIAENFIRHEESGVYYPLKYTEVKYDPEKNVVKDKREYSIDRNSLVLNAPISVEQFSVDVSSGMKVIDYRKRANLRYTAVNDGILSVKPGGLELDSLDWLVLDQNENNWLSNLAQGDNLYRVCFFLVGLGLSIYAVIQIRRRKN